jgi:hypothetical protein
MKEATIKVLAQVVSTGVDIWKENEANTQTNDAVVAKLPYHFCNCYLPLTSNSQFVEANVKEARIVSTTERNEELQSVYAICQYFFVWKTEAFDKHSSNKSPPNLDHDYTSELHPLK